MSSPFLAYACNPWFAIIGSGRSSWLAELLVIHPLSHECDRIGYAIMKYNFAWVRSLLKGNQK